jgi:hypothetical protein
VIGQDFSRIPFVFSCTEQLHFVKAKGGQSPASPSHSDFGDIRECPSSARESAEHSFTSHQAASSAK